MLLFFHLSETALEILLYQCLVTLTWLPWFLKHPELNQNFYLSRSFWFLEGLILGIRWMRMWWIFSWTCLSAGQHTAAADQSCKILMKEGFQKESRLMGKVCLKRGWLIAIYILLYFKIFKCPSYVQTKQKLILKHVSGRQQEPSM